jgi:hypothetical protein
MDRSRRPNRRRSALALLVLVAAVAALVTAAASAMSSAAPTNSGAPSISGSARQNQTLTANNGSWNNTPTSFAYQWQRCTSAGSGCAGIAGATSKTYQLAFADVDQTIRVIVTATNADGSASANSRTTGVIAASNGPTNTVKPMITGTVAIGEQLSTDSGTWTGGARSYTYQWQSCSATGTCANIAGATGQSYDVRSADIGSTVRVAVTAHSAGGSATAYSDATIVVAAAPGNTTTVVTTVPAGKNRPPTIAWISLKRTGSRIYARFRECDDSTAKVKVVEHDSMAHEQGYSRTYSVPGKPCATYARNWLLLARYRHAGRFTVTLHAVDKSSATSRSVSRSLTFR